MINIFRPSQCSIELYTENALLDWFNDYGVEYTSDPDKPGYLLLEIKHIFETGKVAEDFSLSEIKRIKDGKLKIILFYAREPVTFNMIEEYLPKFTDLGVSLESLIVVTGNFNRNELNNFPANLKVIPFFMFDIQTKLMYAGREDISKEPEYKFLCYNGVMKLHRSLLHLMLPKDSGYVSYLKRKYNSDAELETDINNCKSIPAPLANKAKQEIYTESHTLDLSLNEYITNQFKDDFYYYNNTAFSVVSESIVDTWSTFITEKTFKAILSMHPFILVSSPGSNQLLRDHGYLTYEFLFDNTDDIDQETDTYLKINKVVKAVNEFSLSDYNRLTERIYYTAKYNRDLCIKNDYRTRLEKLVKEVTNGYTNTT